MGVNLDFQPPQTCLPCYPASFLCSSLWFILVSLIPKINCLELVTCGKDLRTHGVLIHPVFAQKLNYPLLGILKMVELLHPIQWKENVGKFVNPFNNHLM